MIEGLRQLRRSHRLQFGVKEILRSLKVCGVEGFEEGFDALIREGMTAENPSLQKLVARVILLVSENV